MESLFFHYSEVWEPLGYGLLFFGMVFEGEAALFTAAFLAFSGVLDIRGVAAVGFGGTLLGDLFWHWVGVKIGTPSGPISRRYASIAKPFDHYIISHPRFAVFATKFIYGIHHPVLARSGMLGVSRRTIFLADLWSVCIWLAVVGGLGYFAGSSFALVKKAFRFGEIVLLLGLLIFFGLQFVFYRVFGTRLRQRASDALRNLTA